VTLHFGLPTRPSDRQADIEIIALKCRTEPVHQAVESCTHAAHWLISGGAEHLYWKYCSTFDSTPRGNIGPVAEALSGVTGQSQILYCPAFPENGRTVFMGHLFVGERLLGESSMRHHPLTPMTQSNLADILAPQVEGSVGTWTRHAYTQGQPFPTTPHVIADAIEFEDLVWLVDQLPDHVLMTGGSALAMALPKKLNIARSEQVALPPTPSRAIVLSGSCSSMTQDQVACFAATHPTFRLDPLKITTTTVDDCIDWLTDQPADTASLVYATADVHAVKAAQERLGAQTAGRIVEDTLGAIARAAYHRGIRRFVVAGGETAGAITQALNIDRVSIGPEICPGVPWVFSQSPEDRVALALKSGNFGASTFFSDALTLLEA
jgi:uncharacterized protein YgbK (DUF1537 family)